MLEFQNVSFCYEPGVPAVQGLNFTIQDGESVGLIGANGAGKSTLMQLLLGLLTGDGTITAASAGGFTVTASPAETDPDANYITRAATATKFLTGTEAA